MTRCRLIALIVLLAHCAGCGVEQQAQAVADSEKAIQALVPRQNIDTGTRIEFSKMAVRKFREADVPQGYVPASGFKAVEGRAIKQSLAGGAALTYDALSAFAMQAEIDTLEAEIQERRKAIEELAGCVERCNAKFAELVARFSPPVPAEITTE